MYDKKKKGQFNIYNDVLKYDGQSESIFNGKIVNETCM